MLKAERDYYYPALLVFFHKKLKIKYNSLIQEQWCGYCQPNCPEEIDIPMVINAELMWKLWPKETLLDWYKGKVESAQNCVECGECEEACPYNLPIREMLVAGIDFLKTRMG